MSCVSLTYYQWGLEDVGECAPNIFENIFEMIVKIHIFVPEY